MTTRERRPSVPATEAPVVGSRGGIAGALATRPVRTLLAVLGFVVVAGVVGGPVAGRLGNGGFAPTDADSVLAVARLERATGREPTAGVLLLVRTPDGVAADADRIAAVAGRLDRVRGIAAVAAPAVDDPATSGLIARDGRSVLVAGTLAASAVDDDVATGVLDAFADEPDVTVGGAAVANQQVAAQVGADLARAELMAFPVLVLLSVLLFRGLAALLPVLVGASTVLGTFTVLTGVNHVYGLSIFALNLVSGLGLGLAIDYSLFLVTRYREEAARQGVGTAAILTTMRTAGRTVAFSAATVAAAVCTLTVFPLGFLRSMGIAGAVVAVLAAVSAWVVTPAFLALCGRRVARRAIDDGRADPDAAGAWYVLARAVMRRPGAIALNTGLLMLLLAVPALRVHWTPLDDAVIPTSLSARTVSDAVAGRFDGGGGGTLVALRTDAGLSRADAGTAVAAYARSVGALPGVTGSVVPRAVGGRTWQLDLATAGDPSDGAAQALVRELRGLDPPAGLHATVGGPAASFVDQQQAIGARLPAATALLVLLTVLVLWLMTGSVVLPVKAVIMNALTVGTALGLLTAVYQDGRFTGLLHYTANGGVEPTDFLVTAAVAFALSTDYGVLLLGRIKEVRDDGAGERESVAMGLQRTGRVVTASAILLAVAIGAFSTSKVSFIQQIGVAAAFAVLVDAFVVRSLLVPSLMGLLGRWNWWSPGPLRRLHARLGVRH